MAVIRLLKLALAPLMLAMLAACATSFETEVSRFERNFPPPEGQSFAVVPEDPALAGGLEFSLYADMVAAQLEALGYARAASPEAATLLVRFEYGVDTGREQIRSTGFFRDPFWGPWHGFNRPFMLGGGPFMPGGAWGWGWHDPFFFGGWGGGWGGWGGGWGGGVHSTTVFTSGIQLKIDSVATGERLFEGSAQAASTSARLQYLVPNLVEAIFTGFPGNSGEVLRISIRPESQTSREIRR